jgi:hypothetical protein
LDLAREIQCLPPGKDTRNPDPDVPKIPDQPKPHAPKPQDDEEFKKHHGKSDKT